MAERIGAQLYIEGDKQFKNALQGVNSEIRANSTLLKDLGTQYDKNDKKLADHKKEHQQLTKVIESSKDKVKTLTAEYNRQQTELTKLKGSLDEAKQKYGENSTEVAKAESAVAKQVKTINNLESQINTTNAQINTFNQRLQETANTATYVGDKMVNVGDKMSSIGNKLTVGVTVPLAALGGKALSVAVDFEKGMSAVQAISGATGAELVKLKELAIDLGASTAFSSAEVTAAMTEMAKAGWTTQQILDGMDGVLDAAAASGEGLASVSTIVADSITGFGMAASESARVADVLTYAANAGTIGIADLGETFKYIAPVAKTLGFSIEDVTTATAAMSMAGIKGSQAGTSLKNIITNMVKPTDAMAAVMDDLNLSVTNADGTFKSLDDIITMLRSSFSGLSEEQQASAAATLAGKEGMSGLLALLSLSQGEYDELSKAMQNSAGVAKETAKTMQDNLASDLEQLGGAAETLAIKFGDLVVPALRDVVTGATDVVDKFADMPEASRKNVLAFAGIAAAAGPVVKVTGEVTKGLGNTIKYLGETAKGLGKGAEATTGLSKVIGAVASPAGIATTAILAVSTAAVAYYQHTQKIAKEKDLEEHFGRVKLSAEEVEKIATELTTTDWTIKLSAYMDAKAELEESQKQIADTVAELNKYDWKIKAGFEVTAEDDASYKASIDSFISQTQAYVQDKGYALSLAVDLGFGDSKTGAGLSTFVDSYFSESSAELEDLGVQLADLVNESFENNTFGENRIKIEQIRQQMADVMAEITKYDSEAERLQLQMDIEVDARLDADSYKKVIDKVNESREQVKKDMQEAQKESLKVISMQYDVAIEAGVDPQVADKIRQEAIDVLKINLADEDSKVLITGFDTLFGTLVENYGAELNNAEPALKDELNSVFKNISTETQGYAEQYGDGAWNAYFDRLKNEFSGGSEELSDKAKVNISEMLEALEPNVESLRNIANQYLEAGKMPSDEIIKGLTDAYQLEVLSGNTSHLYELMALQMGDSPEFKDMMIRAEKSGQKIPEGVAFAMEAKYGLVYNSSKGIFEQVNRSTKTIAPDVVKQLNQIGGTLGDGLSKSLANSYGIVYNNGKWLLLNTKDGVYSVLPEVINDLEEAGVDIPDGFIDAMQGKEADVQAQAADLLFKVAKASDEERPALLAQLKALGIDLSDEYILTLLSKKDEVGNVGLVWFDRLQEEIDSNPITAPTISSTTLVASAATAGKAANDRIQSTVGKKVSSPSVSNSNIKSSSNSAAWAGWNVMQYVFNNNPISARVRVVGASAAGLAGLSVVRGYEDGGKITKEELALHGEGNKPEYVIPVSPAKRARGIELLEQAAADLNYPISQLATSRVGEYNYVPEPMRTNTRVSQSNNGGISDNTPILVEAHFAFTDTREFAVGIAPALRKEL